jgi:hypothetical protein
MQMPQFMPQGAISEVLIDNFGFIVLSCNRFYIMISRAAARVILHNVCDLTKSAVGRFGRGEMQPRQTSNSHLVAIPKNFLVDR